MRITLAICTLFAFGSIAGAVQPVGRAGATPVTTARVPSATTEVQTAPGLNDVTGNTALPGPPPATVTTPASANGVPPTPAPAFPGVPAPPSSATTPGSVGQPAAVTIDLRPTVNGLAPATVANAQNQLAAGGFYQGPIDGTLSGPTRSSIRAFQLAAQLPATGDLDAATVTALGLSGFAAATPATATGSTSATATTGAVNNGAGFGTVVAPTANSNNAAAATTATNTANTANTATTIASSTRTVTVTTPTNTIVVTPTNGTTALMNGNSAPSNNTHHNAPAPPSTPFPLSIPPPTPPYPTSPLFIQP